MSINKLSVAALLGGLSACGAAFAQSETQTFDTAASATAAGWTELNSRTAPQNFGFSATANAGGPAGEAGGTFFRQPTATAGAGAYYADTAIGLLNINQPMTFTTKWNSVDRNSEIYVGFFNTAFGAPPQGTAQQSVLPNFLGFRIDDTRVYVEAISARGNPIGSDPSDEGTDVIINEGGTPLTENTVHTLTFTFTPDPGGGVGTVTGQIDNQPAVTATSGRGDDEFSSGFNAFGLHTKGGGDSPQGPQNMFFDNITYTSAIPEPASLGLLGLGAVALMARRRSA
jgi:hypothetical protein